MSCDKGYQGDCCCECEYQLDVIDTVDDKLFGYVCNICKVIENKYICHFKEEKHGSCELFARRKDK